MGNRINKIAFDAVQFFEMSNVLHGDCQADFRNGCNLSIKYQPFLQDDLHTEGSAAHVFDKRFGQFLVWQNILHPLAN